MHIEDRSSDGFLDTGLQIDALPCLVKAVQLSAAVERSVEEKNEICMKVLGKRQVVKPQNEDALLPRKPLSPDEFGSIVA